MNSSRLVKSSTLYLIGNLAQRAVSVIMIPLYTRYLSPADYGIMEIVELAISIVVITLGYSAIAQSMVRIYYDWKDSEDRNAVISTATLTLMVLGIFVTAGAMFGAIPVSQLLFSTSDQTSLVRAFFVASYFGNLVEISLAYERLRDRPVFFVSYNIVQLVVSVILNVYFLVVWRSGIWSFVQARLIVGSLGAIYLTVRTLRETGIAWRVEPLRRMLKFGSPLILSAVCFFIIHFSDRFFLVRFSSLAEVGIYSLAYKAGFIITMFVGQPFGRVWNVSLYEFVDRERWQEYFARVARIFVFCLFVAAVGLSVFADVILRVATSPAFQTAAQILPVIALAYVFREVGDFFRNILYINKERSVHISIVTVFCAALKLALNALLVPSHGGMGAAYATLGTWLAFMAIMWAGSFREHRIPFSLRSFTAVAALALGIWYAGGRLQPAGHLMQWGVDALLVIAFIGGVLLVGYFPAKELANIEALVREFLMRRKRAMSGQAA